MYQKCPVCNGTGLTNRPPGIAGDQEVWASSSTGPYDCKVCNGSGLIFNPDGQHNKVYETTTGQHWPPNDMAQQVL